MSATNFKKEQKGVYSFIVDREKVFITRMYVQGLNKKKSKVISIFCGWSFNGFDTYKTLKELRELYNI